MAILQLHSTDPNFGFVIMKNPASGMQLRNIRKGTAFAWYSNENTDFNIFFKDADNAVSFGDQEFEYLNTSKYNSPMFVLNAISDFFSSTVRQQSDLDTNSHKTFFIQALEVKRISQIADFEKYFKNFSIETNHIAGKTYSLKITTNESWYSLLNYINLMMIFVALLSDEYIHLDQSNIEKYLNSLNRLDAPFFIRYLFSRNMIKSKNQFSKYKSQLETTNLYDSINMAYGNTAMQRKSAIEKLISFDKPIIDIGCGEGFYAIDFAKKIGEAPYVAIDIEESLTNIVNNKAEKKEITNISTFNHIDTFLSELYAGMESDVILTEVIEHMPKEDSLILIKTVLDKINFNKFIITVPNKEFNKFYEIGESESRHDDHDWEPTYNEFLDFMGEALDMTEYNREFISIGDTINGISTSIGCVITKS